MLEFCAEFLVEGKRGMHGERKLFRLHPWRAKCQLGCVPEHPVLSCPGCVTNQGHL